MDQFLYNKRLQSPICTGNPWEIQKQGQQAKEPDTSFKEMLERRTGLSVILWDERLTTTAAEQILIESGVRRENRKAVIDKVAASLILQGYLDSLAISKVNTQPEK